MSGETLHPNVTGIYRVRVPEDKLILQPDNDGIIKAKLLSGIEIEVQDNKVTYQYDDSKITVTGGVNFDDLEIVDTKTMKVRQSLTPRQRLIFFSRIGDDTTAFEEVVIET